MALHPYVVPAVATAATCVPLYLDKADYALTIALCGVYFALISVVPGAWRLRNFYAARAALTVAAAVAIWDLAGRGSDAVLATSVLLAVQVLGLGLLSARLAAVFARTKLPGQSAGAPQGAFQGPPAGDSRSVAGARWQADAMVTFALQLAATAAFGVAQEVASFVQGFVSEGLADRELAVPLWIPVACSLLAGMVLAAVILVQLVATALLAQADSAGWQHTPPRHLRPWAALRQATSSAGRQAPSGWRRSHSAHCWPSVTGRVDAGRLDAGALEDEPVRHWSLAGGAFLGLLLVAMAGTRHDATSWTAAAVLAAALGIAYREAPAKARRIALEVGALVLTAALQRAAIFALDVPVRLNGRVLAGLPDPFWVAQWYVVLGAVLGGWRYVSGHQQAGRFLVGAAAGLLSLGALGVVFSGTGAQQLWVLVLLALLLVAGLVAGERLFVGWGAAGVAACILWAMRHYTFLLLAVIALGLIAFAVWLLNRGPAGAGPGAGPATGPIAGPGGGSAAGPNPSASPWRVGGREQSSGPQSAATGNRPRGTDTVADSERSTSWNG
jgi:hypothetical protein